tara:strand:- start:178 stop:384 length:207 start_codon:yes stop_codon:yes gene_type:complete
LVPYCASDDGEQASSHISIQQAIDEKNNNSQQEFYKIIDNDQIIQSDEKTDEIISLSTIDIEYDNDPS